MADYRKLIQEYKGKKSEIRKRLREFKEAGKGGPKEIFSELCFCILTPQSNARQCDKAIRELERRGLLLNGRVNVIRPVLKGRARFHNKKAEYLVMARRAFDRSVLKSGNVFDIRRLLVRDIKGIGHKEASHFLRNIGLGREIAILDRHILKNLKKYGVIDKVPSSITVKSYMDIEDKARLFARSMGLGLDELDLLLWSKETGEIFK